MSGRKTNPKDVSGALLLAAQAIAGGEASAWLEAVKLSMLGNHATLAGLLRSAAEAPPKAAREYLASFVLDPPVRRRGALPIEADPVKQTRKRLRDDAIGRFVVERWAEHARESASGGSPQQHAFADAAAHFNVSEATADSCFRTFRRRMADSFASTQKPAA